MWHDLRYALRALLENRIFTLPAILSLALGIGANVAIFTFIQAIFLHPLPIEQPSELVTVFSRNLEDPAPQQISYPNYLDYRQQSREIFRDLAASRRDGFTFSQGEGTQRLFGEVVTTNYFDLLGVKAAAGRTFQSQEGQTPGTHPVVVLSFGLWQRLLGSDPKVVGRNVRINDRSFTVIGVAAASFRGLDLMQSPDLWLPMKMHQQVVVGRAADRFDRRDGRILNVFGRLRPGIDSDQAETVLETLARNLAESFPEQNEGLGVGIEPLIRSALPARIRGKFVLAGWLLMGVVSLLLIVACANVANLLLTRSLARRRETAIRLALGAGRRRLFQRLLTEGLVLSLGSGIAALALAVSFRKLLWDLRPSYLPDNLDLGFNSTVLGFALGLALLTGIFFSLAPAIQSFRLDLISELKERAGGGSRQALSLRNLLVVVQVTLSTVVLVGCGLFVNSLVGMQRIDPGFETENLFLIPVAVGAQGYSEAEGLRFYRRMAERVRLLDPVADAAVAAQPIPAPGGRRTILDVEDPTLREGIEETLVFYNVVGPRYFETLSIGLVAGRGFTDADRQDTVQVAIINQTMQRWLGLEGTALGKRFRLEDQEGFVEIIGVAADAKYGGLTEEPKPYFYLPVEQHYTPSTILHVRAKGNPAAVAALARHEVHALDRNLPLLETRLLSQLIDFSLWAPRMIASLLAFFSLLALLLSAIGIYGVVAYAVNQRKREIGIRMAMGAGRLEMLNLVLKQGMRTVGLGIAAGLLVAIVASRWISGLLHEVSSRDPATLAGVVLVLAAIALMAIAIPAWRAATVNPVTVLRDE